MGGYHIAVVGATGAAGTELLRVLERRNFPVASLRPIGSPRSAGKSVQFCGDSIPVEKLDARSFEKIDIAFFSAGGDVSRNYVPIACQADAIAIDKSSAFRMDPHVPLVIPEINAEDVKLHRGVIANPNCTTTVMLMALYPLHKIFRVRRIFAATYQAVSGSGTRGVEELTRQTKTWAEDQESCTRRPAGDATAANANQPRASHSDSATVFPHPIAFNLLPHVDSFLESGYTKEEVKIRMKRARSCTCRRCVFQRLACAFRFTARTLLPSPLSSGVLFRYNKRAKFCPKPLDWNWWMCRKATNIPCRSMWLEKIIVRLAACVWIARSRTGCRFGFQAINYSKARP